jgi:methylglyoxal synthase
VCTQNTGIVIEAVTGLDVSLVQNGKDGGYLELEKLIKSDEIKLVIFLHDPLTMQLNEPGFSLLLTSCTLHNVPLASNISTADFIIHRYLEMKMASVWRCPSNLLNFASQ